MPRPVGDQPSRGLGATRPADGPEPYGAYPTNQGANVSVVKINVLEVPEGRGEVLEQRFAARAGEVEKVDGFESFDLLRPTEGTDRYLVVTKWRDDESFQAWMNSQAFQKGHAQSGGSDRPASDGPSHGEGERPSGPAATGSELWGFEVVTSATGRQA